MLSLSTILAFLAPVAFRPPAPQVKEPDAIGMALLRTAAIIREKGWSRGSGWRESGEVCVGVAIAQALGRNSYMGVEGTYEVWERFAVSHRIRAQRNFSPAYWNDCLSKDTKESLIAALEKAAYA